MGSGGVEYAAGPPGREALSRRTLVQASPVSWPGELFFCMACGCHARRQVKDMALRCNRGPSSGAERLLKLLRNGVGPTSKKE
eukprot:4688041-Pyramimonas_sp.AAC.1